MIGSPRRLGRLLLLLGGGWSLLWMTATAWCIIQANLGPDVGGEYAGYAVMGVMMTVLGLVMTLKGIRLARTSRKSHVAENGKPAATESSPGRKVNSLAATAVVLGVLGFMSAGVFGIASVICGILALRTPGIDSKNRAFAWAGTLLGVLSTVLFLVHLLGKV